MKREMRYDEGGGWSGDKRKRAGQEREMLDVERDLKKVKEREEK